MTSGDVSGVTVTVRRDTALTGRFRMVSDNPAARWPPHIHVNAQLIVGSVAWPGGGISEGAPGGRFILRNAFGPRILRCGYTLDKGTRWWPSRVLLDGEDVTDIPTDFSQRAGGQLEVLFTQHPSRFIGTVIHRDGRPASGAWVFIAAEDPKLWQPWASTSHVVRADAGGAFAAVTLPGRYVARAFPPNVLVSRRRTTDHIAKIGPGAKPIELREREQKKIILTVEQPSTIPK